MQQRAFETKTAKRLSENDRYEMVPRFEIHNMSRSKSELLLKLAVAGIDNNKSTI